jgi:hypothetical protein
LEERNIVVLFLAGGRTPAFPFAHGHRGAHEGEIEI